MAVLARKPRPLSRETLEQALAEAQRQRVAALEQAEITTAALDAARTDLRGVLDIVRRIGGYLSPEDQALLREARARLAEAGGAR